MKKKSIIVLLLLSFQSFCQIPDFREIDIAAKNTSVNDSKTVQQLAKSLVKNCKTDIEKVRSFYVWIATNIRYDFVGFKTGKVPEQSANSTLRSKLAVCQGYSELFYSLCRLNNIDCYLVTGYSKGYGYKQSKKFEGTDHAWNAVKIDKKWHLIDVTWGSGYVNENNQYVVYFAEEHFLSSPQSFILKHLPADPMWQLLPEAITISTFEKDSTFIKKAIATSSQSINYADTLSYFATLDSVSKIINSSMRIIRYNPDNADAWYKMGWFYFQNAWLNMEKLNNVAVQRNKSLARPLAVSAINYQNEALKYLKEAEKRDSFYDDDIRQKRQIISQNMKSLQQIIK